MADVRSLLRQQREARRIEHPNAAYSEAGKLLCTLCRELVKTESLWDTHLRSPTHRQRLENAKISAPPDGAGAKAPTENVELDQLALPAHQKRKLDGDEDNDVDMLDGIRRKKSRPDIAENTERHEPEKDVRLGQATSELRTPPSLARRPSRTPSQGIEIQIPSRPATPSRKDGSSSSTPGTASFASNASQPQKPAATTQASVGNGPAAPAVDESEWAAFEAEMAAADTAAVTFDENATISAPAMTTEQVAAAKEEAEKEAAERKAKADVDIEAEKEEASRAWEEEFEEMEELEKKVQRLKEKRESIRKLRTEFIASKGEQTTDAGGSAIITQTNGNGPKQGGNDSAVVDDEDEDDESDDDWDTFRFRGVAR